MVFLPVFFAAGALAKPTPPAPMAAKDDLSFGTYRTFFDHISQRMRQATKGILVATNSFTDGDLATTVFVAQLRGTRVRVAQWSGASGRYNSRAPYFTQVGVPYRVFSKPLKDPTGICIDGQGWAVDQVLESSWSGTVTLLPKNHLCQEMEALWEESSSAKVPTERPPRRARPSVRVETSGKRGLPRETRWQQIQNGTATHDELGPMPPRPPVAPPDNESDLP